MGCVCSNILRSSRSKRDRVQHFGHLHGNDDSHHSSRTFGSGDKDEFVPDGIDNEAQQLERLQRVESEHARKYHSEPTKQDMITAPSKYAMSGPQSHSGGGSHCGAGAGAGAGTRASGRAGYVGADIIHNTSTTGDEDEHDAWGLPGAVHDHSNDDTSVRQLMNKYASTKKKNSSIVKPTLAEALQEPGLASNSNTDGQQQQSGEETVQRTKPKFIVAPTAAQQAFGTSDSDAGLSDISSIGSDHDDGDIGNVAAMITGEHDSDSEFDYD
jgi:hypothetical protein